jgi:hypothetical protein
MLLQTRLDAPGILNYIIMRGIEGIRIFGFHRDRRNSLSRILLIIIKTEIKLLAWALMDRIGNAEVNVFNNVIYSYIYILGYHPNLFSL